VVSDTKKLCVNYVYLQRHFAERDDGGGYVVERDEAAFEFLVSHQQLAETIEPAVTDLGHPAPSMAALAALACELGFVDSAAFQRAFKNWTGSAPGAYRRAGM
jgi:AraC-like DNA-binding protein